MLPDTTTDFTTVAVTVAFVDLAGQPRPHRPTTRARLVKTIGDAVMPAADTQMMATLADLADRAAGEDGFLAIRAVIHHGHAVARGGDYFGHAVDIAARITALAGAGRAVIIDDINKAAAARGLASNLYAVPSWSWPTKPASWEKPSWLLSPLP